MSVYLSSDSTGPVLFNRLPWELVKMILCRTGGYRIIASQTCKEWRRLTTLSEEHRGALILALVKYQDLKMIEWLIRNGGKLGRTVGSFLARVGRLDLLQLGLYEEPNPHVMIHYAHVAARCGQLEVLLWLKPYWNDSVARAAGKSGSLEVIKEVLTTMEGPCTSLFLSQGAAREGHLHVLEWIIENDYELSGRCGDRASEGGHLHVLQRVATIGIAVTKSGTRYAVQRGHLHVLEWLKETNRLIDQADLRSIAVRRRHTEVFRFLLDNKLGDGPITPHTAVTAMNRQSRSEILQLLIQHQLLPDLNLCVRNAAKRHLGLALDTLMSMGAVLTLEHKKIALSNGPEQHKDSIEKWFQVRGV